MTPDATADLTAGQILSLVSELHVMETDRDNALLDRDKAMGIATEAIQLAERAMSGRAVHPNTLKELRDQLEKM